MKCRHSYILIGAVLAISLLAAPRQAQGQPLPSGEKAASQEDSATPPAETTSFIDRLELKVLFTGNTVVSWALLALGIAVGLIGGKITGSVLRSFARRLEARGWTLQEQVVRGLARPAGLAVFTAGLSAGLANLDMSGPLGSLCAKTILLLFSIAVIWYAYNLVDVLEMMFRRLTAGAESLLDQRSAPLIRRSLRVVLLVFGTLFVANTVFEWNIGAWLAALGIAGLAIPLAAGDSLKNLFGSITILMDRPFHIGERIVYAGFDGVIEEIGLRSTKVRTATGHLVTIPNSNIVNEPVENIGRRPFIRRTLNVTITYDTPRAKIEEAVKILRDLLEEEGIREPIHPVINGGEFPPRVYFNDYNAESLNIFVIYWFAPPAYWDYMQHAEKLNLRIFEEFDTAGIEFAFPTQTIFLARDRKRQLAIEMLGKDLDQPG